MCRMAAADALACMRALALNAHLMSQARAAAREHILFAREHILLAREPFY
jgi:hypothetical protein